MTPTRRAVVLHPQDERLGDVGLEPAIAVVPRAVRERLGRVLPDVGEGGHDPEGLGADRQGGQPPDAHAHPEVGLGVEAHHPGGRSDGQEAREVAGRVEAVESRPGPAGS